jgi:AcrR family transcriptional regulator
MTNGGPARDRLLLAAAQLLAESGDRTVTTRAICDLAGVRSPTLYHHFGRKQGLIDAVINHGFTQYLRSAASGGSEDPVHDIRLGWDRHVQFGLEHPTFYRLLYGQIEPGRPCAITAPAHAMLEDLLAAVASQGRLTVPPADAAAQILAANVGVTLSLITQPRDTVDLGLSERVREAALAGILADPHEPHGDQARRGALSRASAALALRALLDDDASGLSSGEAALLRELLDRLSRFSRCPAVDGS